MVSRYRTLWIVKKDMLANHDYKDTIGDREVTIKKGEIIEWRYECHNHFRTMDDRWFWVEDKTWEDHCLKIGLIYEKVSYNNKAKTEEIWRLKLFDWTNEEIEIYQRIKEELEVKK